MAEGAAILPQVLAQQPVRQRVWSFRYPLRMATYIYRLADKGRRMILHHASSGQQAERLAQDR